MVYVLGIDGGGTATTALLATDEGCIVAAGTGGPSNFRAVGMEIARASLTAAIEATFEPARNVAWEEVAAVTVGLAGIHVAADGALIAALLQPLLPSARIAAYNDGVVALAGATGGEPGVVVVAGTGSVAIGAGRDGREVRCGGWGHVIGDEGSAYAIACTALGAAARAADGRDAHTTLVDALVAALGLAAFDGIVDRVYGPPAMTRHEIAALAPVVVRCAAAGDAAAQEVLATAARELAGMATTLARRLDLGPEPFPVACSGNTWNAGPFLQEPFARQVHATHPAASIGPPLLVPAAGAVLLALRALDGRVPSALIIGRLQATGGAWPVTEE